MFLWEESKRTENDVLCNNVCDFVWLPSNECITIMLNNCAFSYGYFKHWRFNENTSLYGIVFCQIIELCIEV